MNTKKIIAIFMFLIILTVSLTSCKDKSGDETESTSENLSVVATTVNQEETSAPTESTTNEEETTDKFDYDSETAQYIGKFNSEIYGTLKVYYQENHLAIFDEYSSMIFTLNAEGFAPAESTDSEDTVICEDLDFDGYSDLRILYRKTTLNSYYLCWIWNMSLKTYVYYEPLTNIPSPVFDILAKNVISTNRTTANSATVTTYSWQDGELYPISHKTTSVEGEVITGPEVADSTIAISDGILYSSVSLTGNSNSTSKWICKIEDENIVRLYSDTSDAITNNYQFTFRGVRQGTTTVVFRYATDWSADYISEKVVNITVNADKTLTIVATK